MVEVTIIQVEASNHKTQSQPVMLPASENMAAMKQDIQFDQSGNLQIKSYPTETPKDSDVQSAFNLIKDQAQELDVNVDTNSIQKLIAQAAAQKVNSSAPTADISNGGNNSTTSWGPEIITTPPII